MDQIRKILVPVDFSECSRAAVDEAAWIAGKTGADLSLLHVWQPVAFLAPDIGLARATPGAGAYSEALHQSARKDLASFVDELRARGTSVHSAWCEQGLPAPVIVETAKNSDVDLVVMGTHGLSGLEHALIGSVVEKVLRRAPCPVLSVRAGMSGEFPRQVRRMLVPIDYSDGSKLGLRAALALAALLGAEVDVVHVWDRPEWLSDTMVVKWDGGTPRSLGALIHENEERQLQDFLGSLPEVTSSTLKPRLLEGDAASALLKELDAGRYDLCVASTHGRSGFKHLLLGSVTETLVRLARVPVLTVPPRRQVRVA